MSINDPIEFPPDCEVVVRAIWDYLDGVLTPDKVAEIEAHLDACDYCVAHTDFERQLVHSIRRIRREHSDPSRLRDRVRNALREAAAGNGAAQDG